jgi:hypothetical protein
MGEHLMNIVVLRGKILARVSDFDLRELLVSERGTRLGRSGLD